MATLRFLSQNRCFNIASGTELTQAQKIDPSIPLKFGCQQGKCGVCIIRVSQGIENLSKCTKQEKVTLAKLNKDDGIYRLACQCAILDDITVDS